jgi:hypothetical protein
MMDFAGVEGTQIWGARPTCGPPSCRLSTPRHVLNMPSPMRLQMATGDRSLFASLRRFWRVDIYIPDQFHAAQLLTR